MGKAIVIFSGGQDSTTCLGWSKNRYEEIVALSFNYGQRHLVEIEQAEIITKALGVSLKIVDVSFYADIVNSALVGQGNINAKHDDNQELPASFVPNRNAFFILLAHAYAQKVKAQYLVAGFCQTDFSGYPDCREDFTKSIEHSLNIGSNQNIKLVTPLMHLTKAETFLLANEEKVLDLVIKESHTCYEGNKEMHDWGRGCNNCPACLLRKNGFNEFIQKNGD